MDVGPGAYAYQCQCVEVLGVALRLELSSQLEDLGILLGCCVARVPVLRNRGNSGVVVVVVLGVELELVGGSGSHRGYACEGELSGKNSRKVQRTGVAVYVSVWTS